MASDNKGKSLGKIIKQLRVGAGLTLRELSKRSGISESHLSRVETGERFPSAHTLKRLAKHLGVGEGKLLTLAGYMSPQPLTEVETVTENIVRQLKILNGEAV